MKKFKYLITGFLLSFLSVACSDRPSNVLSEDKMVDLLVDMELTEAYSNIYYSPGKDKNDLGRKVLKEHGISEETLDTTLAWYGRNMDEYSALYEKVDKKIHDRKKKFMEFEGEEKREPDNLWPYNPHVVISPNGGTDALNFAIMNPDIDRGDILDFSFYLPNVENIRGSLIVVYKDGEGEAVTQTFSSKRKINLELHTDSAREVSRIYGTMSVKDIKILPLYIDSISLKAEPVDTLNYRMKRRNLKSFGPVPAI